MTRSPYQYPAVEEEESDESWKLQGLCRREDPEKFFPLEKSKQAARSAKEVCLQCPVLTRCREWAITHYEVGIWGGLTERERRRVRKGMGLPDPYPPQRCRRSPRRHLSVVQEEYTR